MKFIAFNLIVGAALIYLFSADRADLQALTDKTYDMGQEVRQKVNDLTGGPDEAPKPAPQKIVKTEPPAPQPVKAEEPSIQAEKPEPPRAPAAPEAPQKAGRKAPVQVAQKPQSKPRPVSKQIASADDLPPEVLKRRNEILEPNQAQAKTQPQPVREPNPADTARNSERRDHLLRLAEDMELYSLETLAQ